MKVLVISGFLGVGKTTFIKELIRRTGKQIAILENEFGDTSIDSDSLSSNNGIKVTELSEGCVCCTMREGFFNSVVTIASVINPDYLVVEPSGIAMLSNVISNLNKASYENIRILPPIVLISPLSLNEHLRDYKDICLDQIRNADKILFTKAEHESADILGSMTAIIRDINPDADVVSNHYSLMEDEWWASLLMDRDVAAPIESENENIIALEECSFSSISMHNPAELIALLEDILRGLYGKIVRAKGVVLIRGEKVHFDLADGMYSIIGDDEFIGDTQCVFIGTDLKRLELQSHFVRIFSSNEPIIRRLK